MLRRAAIVLLVALAASAASAPAALAQTSQEDIQKAAEDGTLTPEQLTAAIAAALAEQRAAGGTLPDGSAIPGLPQAPLDGAPADGESAIPPGLPIPGLGGGGAGSGDSGASDGEGGEVAAGTTPGPPAYLAPGPGAQQQPIAAVAALTVPEVPLEPVRLAALIAALLAAFGIAMAVLLRALGLRTPVVDPVASAPDGPVSRMRERIRGTADDMRDFLRRSR